jgi:hypothetical protein
MGDETGKENTTHGGSGVRNADIFSENITERDHLGKAERSWKIILKLLQQKWDVWLWTGFIWLSTRSSLSFNNEAIMGPIIA